MTPASSSMTRARPAQNKSHFSLVLRAAMVNTSHMPADQTPADRIAAKIHSLLAVDSDLRSSTIIAGGLSVTVMQGHVGITSNHGAGFEKLPSGVSYREIAAHISDVVSGRKSAPMAGSEVMIASGGGWVMLAA